MQYYYVAVGTELFSKLGEKYHLVQDSFCLLDSSSGFSWLPSPPFVPISGTFLLFPGNVPLASSSFCRRHQVQYDGKATGEEGRKEASSRRNGDGTSFSQVLVRSNFPLQNRSKQEGTSDLVFSLLAKKTQLVQQQQQRWQQQQIYIYTGSKTG